jgi:ribosomal-protein-alanine N-acetyltransferase
MALPVKARRLEIRALEPEDLSSVHACVSDPLVAQWFPWGPNTERETREFIEGAVRAATISDRRSFVLGIALQVGGLVGVCFFDRTNEGEFELGYYLRRDCWDRGFATEVLAAVVPFAFGELGARRIFARVDPGNPPSARVLEHAGFPLEANLSGERFIKGERRKSLVYVPLAGQCAV